ncbi:MAG: 7TM diverse intracellular signaling domain-containing protein [Mucilaginibacter sp.]|uniref:7TM diverse intracellular signaling domain-containing protein n=1 Tax=Mucilaginibacter sp. TaxID=1882438 RepID=UPI0031A13268
MIKPIPLLYVLLLCVVMNPVFGQKTININSTVHQHIFNGAEIEYLEDNSNKLTIDDIRTDSVSHLFQVNKGYYPKNKNVRSDYWYKIKVNFDGPMDEKQSVFEFFDQTTELITAYVPDNKGLYTSKTAGASTNFVNRLYHHKNFEFSINNKLKGEHIYYFKIRSANSINVIIVYRTIGYFIHYALTEYLTYGLFYGMLLIFCFHNLLMFLAVRKKHYLFYVLYVMSVGFYEMSTDGIAFQYIWPELPGLNAYAYGVSLYFISLFALLFTKDLLDVRHKAPIFNKIINYVIGFRTLYLLFCLFINPGFFIYKFVEVVPLSVAFVTGIKIWSNGYKPARFFVVAYASLFIGVIFKVISVLGAVRGMGLFAFYGLSFSFIAEMIFFSIAIADQVRLLRTEKEAAKDEIIRQMAITNQLKDSINQELEIKVNERTRQVIEKSRKISEQAEVIEQQNADLINTNKEIERQAAEISLMNVLLERDNIQLKHNIEKVTDARVLSAELSFEEFSSTYPDQESCNKFLSELKWAKGYGCLKCASTLYKNGRAPYSRRCTKCGYEESVLFNTIFQNNRIPINKAFYVVYLMYSTKGTISSYQLSEKIGIRQSTCWQYAIRIKKVMNEHKKDGRKGANQGWSRLVIDHKPAVTGRIKDGAVRTENVL